MHVKQDTAIDDATAQLKQTMERKSSNVGLTPSLSTILHIFLKLQPPVK